MNPLNMVCGHLDMAGMTYANVITTKYQKKLLATFYTNWRLDMLQYRSHYELLAEEVSDA